MTSSSRNSKLYSHKILTAVIDFLCAAGADEAEIRGIVDKRLGKARSESNKVARRGAGRGDDTVTAAVLHRWHRDRDLLDADANPKPLRLYGPAPSVESIAKSERPSGSAKSIVTELVSLGLIRKASPGLFLPKARVATIGVLHPVLIEHVSQSLVRLLETVQSNTSRAPDAAPLIERFTHIPDLPASLAGDFRNFSQEHGSAFLASVDDWLEARRARNLKWKKGRTLSAGVHVYAYVGRPKSTASRKEKPRPTPRAKRA